MKIKTTREALLEAVKTVAEGAEKKGALTILSHMLLETDGDALRMTATNLEQQISTTVPLPGGILEDGRCTLPAKRLSDIVDMAEAGSAIDLSASEEGGKATIKAGCTRYFPPTLAAENFPSFDRSPELFWDFEIAVGLLASAMDTASYSMASRDVRYYLNGMCLSLNRGKLSAVASDGHRLVFAPITEAQAEDRAPIIPRNSIRTLLRLLKGSDGACRIALSANALAVSAGRTEYATRLIEGRFPDFVRLIPRHTADLTIPRVALAASLKRQLAMLASMDGRGVLLECSSGNLKLSGETAEGERCVDEIEIEGDAEISIGFSPRYLLEAISHADGDTVVLRISKEGQSTSYFDGTGESMHMVMPMRV